MVRCHIITRRIIEKRSVAINAVTENNWTAAVDVFSAVLRETACKRIHLILSNHFTQYQLAPWRDDLHDSQEELAVAALSFNETYGEVASRWNIRLSDSPPQEPRLATALENELINALELAAATAKAKLVSVQPYLVAVANHWCDRFERDRNSWLVLYEEDRICLALIEHGQWRWVRCVRAGTDWVERLTELVEHEVLLAGVDSLPAEVLLFAPGQAELSLPAGGRFSFHSLRLAARPGFSPLTDNPFSLALVGQ
jgi:hypothetical protein